MVRKTASEIEALFRHPDAVRKAMEHGIRRAVWEHKQLGNPVCVWRDGKVVWLQPHEIDIEPPDDIDLDDSVKKTL